MNYSFKAGEIVEQCTKAIKHWEASLEQENEQWIADRAQVLGRKRLFGTRDPETARLMAEAEYNLPVIDGGESGGAYTRSYRNLARARRIAKSVSLISHNTPITFTNDEFNTIWCLV